MHPVRCEPRGFVSVMEGEEEEDDSRSTIYFLKIRPAVAERPSRVARDVMMPFDVFGDRVLQ